MGTVITKADQEQRRFKDVWRALVEKPMTGEELFRRVRGSVAGWCKPGASDRTMQKALSRALERMIDKAFVEKAGEGRTATYRITANGDRALSLSGERAWSNANSLWFSLNACRAWIKRILPADSHAELDSLLALATSNLESASRQYMNSGGQSGTDPKAIADAIRVVPEGISESPLEPPDEQVTSSIFEAISRRRVLSFTYQSKRSKRPDATEVSAIPLGLVLKGHRLYLIGEDQASPPRRRAWRIHGITHAKCMDASFRHGEDFDLDEFLAKARPLENPVDLRRVEPQKIKIRVHPDPLGSGNATVLMHLKELRVASASAHTLTPCGNGAILEIEHPDTEELRRWILGYAPSLEVLEPPYLREALADAHKAALGRLEGHG